MLVPKKIALTMLEHIKKLLTPEKIGLEIFEQVIASLPEIMYIKDTKSQMLYVNDTYVKVYGKPREDIIGKTDETLFGPDHFKRTRPEDLRVMHTKIPLIVENDELWPDGTIHRIRNTRCALYLNKKDGNEKLVGTFGICLDLSNSKYRTIFNATPNVIILTLRPSKTAKGKTEYQITDLNQAAQTIEHLTPKLTIGKPISPIIHQLGLLPIIEKTDQGIPLTNEERSLFFKPMRFLLNNNKEVWRSILSITKLPEGEILLAYTDDTEKERLKKYDFLTGLPNYEYFKENLAGEINNQASDKFSAILCIGLGYLNLQDAGRREAILKSFANTLKQEINKEKAFVARWESERFLVFLPEITTTTNIYRLIGRIQQKITLQDLPIHVGISLMPNDATTVERLIDHAHHAYLRTTSTETIIFHNEQKMIALRKEEAQRIELYQVLRESRLTSHYQIQFDGNQRPRGAEALGRILTVNKEIKSLGLYIEVAEKYPELITAIGSNIFNIVCGHIQKFGFNSLTSSINISPYQITPKLYDTLKTILELTNITCPENIILEITEGGFGSNENEEAIKVIKDLHEKLGLAVSIDDFGKGMSNLRRLRAYPISELKIDGDYIKAMLNPDGSVNKENLALVRAIITMARELNYKIVAEYVETEHQFDLLRDLGIDFFQGFYFEHGKPMPVEAYNQLLTSGYSVDTSLEPL